MPNTGIHVVRAGIEATDQPGVAGDEAVVALAGPISRCAAV